MAGGYGNNVYKVCCSKRTVVVRVFPATITIYVNTRNVVVAMRAAELGGQGVEVIASFNNGIIYAFQTGELTNPIIPGMDSKIIRK